MTPSQESAEKVLVLGIGNVLLTDEGAGVHAVQRLSQELSGFGGVKCLDGGSLGFTLVSDIENCDALIVIDAAELGRTPGSVAVFEGTDMDRFLDGPGTASAHETGLRDLMTVAALGRGLPSRRALIGIQADCLEWGTSPTEPVVAAVGTACALARELVERWTMQTFQGIPVVTAQQPRGSSRNARALLHEVAALLERLVRDGESASIDLSGMPLTEDDYRQLHEVLGAGTVVARIQAGGTTEVRETGCPGAWWVTYASEGGAVLAELIEVCTVPSILAAPAEDVSEGLARLQHSLGSTVPISQGLRS